MAYRLEILGPPRVISLRSGEEVPISLGKPLALMAYLAVENRPVAREELCEVFWPESSGPKARQSLRQALWLIRRTLGEDSLDGDDPICVTPALATDLKDLRDALDQDDADGARNLWRGPLLSRLALSGCDAWEVWLDEHRERLRAQYSRSIAEGGRALKEAGNLEKARDFIEEAVLVNPVLLPARIIQVEVLLDLRLLGPARRALADAQRSVGDFPGAQEELLRVTQYLETLEREDQEEDLSEVGKSLEFVGRSEQLDDLRRLWKRAERGVPSVALIQGGLGVGKTRLAREFGKEANGKGGRVVEVRGYPGEETISLGIIVDLVGELMTLPGAAGVSASSNELLAPLAPGSAMGGGPFEGNGDRQPATIAHAVTDLIEAVAFETPLVLLFDDIHLSDPESELVLLRVIRRVRNVPCLFILTQRTGEAFGGPDRDRHSTEPVLDGLRIDLRPFTEGEVGELLTLFGEFSDPTASPDVIAEIFHVSGGNPLFISEMLRTLAEDGVCRFDSGRWFIDCEALPKELALPGTLQSALDARISRMTADELSVACIVASSARNVPLRDLQESSELDGAALSRVVAELRRREILTVMADGTLGITHEQLRRAVLRKKQDLSRSTERGGRRIRWGVGLAATLTILVVIPAIWYFSIGKLSGNGVQPTFPYGQGTLFVLADSAFELVAPARETDEWTVRPASLEVPAPDDLWSSLRGPFRTSDGQLRWFGQKRVGEEPPYAVEFLPGGEERMVYRQAGDVGFQSLSPDGMSGLLSVQRLDREIYSHRILKLDLGSKAADTLLTAEVKTTPALWSPDGQRIAVRVVGPADTLLVISPNGKEFYRRVFEEYEEEIESLSWCPDGRHMAVSIFSGAGSRGILLDTATGEESAFGTAGITSNQPVCLGHDRPTVAYLGWTEGQTDIVLESPGDGRRQVLKSFPSSPVGALKWVPDHVDPPVVGLEIRGPESPLSWGDSRTLHSWAIRSDGTLEPVTPQWSSREPNVASVNTSGEVTGNRVGSTFILAVLNGWLFDSIGVEVREGSLEQEDLLFREAFETGNLERWSWEGTHPEPIVVITPSFSALQLLGDGQYTDPVVSRLNFPLHQGATLEFEFRFPLTDRQDRQRFQACLQQDFPGMDGISPPPFQRAWEACFTYPTGELSKLQRDKALFRSGTPVREMIDVTGSLPSEDWHHLAIQVRADGIVSLFLDRRLIHESSVAVGLSEADRWRVRFQGAAVDTELLVRNIAVWRGMRLGGEEETSEGSDRTQQ